MSSSPEEEDQYQILRKEELTDSTVRVSDITVLIQMTVVSFPSR